MSIKAAFEKTCGPHVQYLAHAFFALDAKKYLEIKFKHSKERTVCCGDAEDWDQAASEIGRAAAADAVCL